MKPIDYEIKPKTDFEKRILKMNLLMGAEDLGRLALFNTEDKGDKTYDALLDWLTEAYKEFNYAVVGTPRLPEEITMNEIRADFIAKFMIEVDAIFDFIWELDFDWFVCDNPMHRLIAHLKFEIYKLKEIEKNKQK